MTKREELFEKVEKIVFSSELVGDMLYSDAEFDFLVSLTKNLVRRGGSTSQQEKALIFVCLVELAKRWKMLGDDSDVDKQFWKHVYTNLEVRSEPTAYNFLTGVLRSLFHDVPSIEAGKRYYATILMHALAPRKSIFSFFDLLWTAFSKDLDFEYDEETELGYVKEVVRSFRETALKEDAEKSKDKEEKLKLGSKVYALQIGLKSFVKQENLKDNFLTFTSHTLKLICENFNKRGLVADTYSKVLISEWWEDLIRLSDEDVYVRTKEKATTKSRLKARIMLNETNACLFIPPIRLEESYILSQPSIKVVIENERGSVLKEESLRTIRREFIYTTKEFYLKINEIGRGSNNFTVKVLDGAVVFYEETFKQDFMLFDGTRDVKANVLQAGNYTLFSYQSDAMILPENVSPLSKNHFAVFAQSGERLGIGDRQIFFTAKKVRDIDAVAMTSELLNCEYKEGDLAYEIHSTPLLGISGKHDLNQLELLLNGEERTRLSELPYYVVDDELLLIDLTDVLQDNELNKLTVYCYKASKSIYTNTLMYSKDLKLKFCKSLYFGEGGVLQVSNSGSIKSSFDLDEQEVKVVFASGYLHVEVPFFNYKIGNRDWQNCKGQVLAVNDIDGQANLKINAKGNKDEVLVYLECLSESENETDYRKVLYPTYRNTEESKLTEFGLGFEVLKIYERYIDAVQDYRAFSVGDYVMHKSYGRGQIESIGKIGNYVQIKVKYKDATYFVPLDNASNLLTKVEKGAISSLDNKTKKEKIVLEVEKKAENFIANLIASNGIMRVVAKIGAARFELFEMNLEKKTDKDNIFLNASFG